MPKANHIIGIKYRNNEQSQKKKEIKNIKICQIVIQKYLV